MDPLREASRTFSKPFKTKQASSRSISRNLNLSEQAKQPKVNALVNPKVRRRFPLFPKSSSALSNRSQTPPALTNLSFQHCLPRTIEKHSKSSRSSKQQSLQSKMATSKSRSTTMNGLTQSETALISLKNGDQCLPTIPEEEISDTKRSDPLPCEYSQPEDTTYLDPPASSSDLLS